MANPLQLSPAFRKFIEQLLCCWSPENLTVTDLTVSDDLTVGGDAAVTGGVTAADLTATDDLVVGDDATVGGDLAVTGAVTAADVTVTDDLVVTDDMTLGGLFTRATVDQPIIRKGTGTLAGGTLVVAATWVTAAPGTVIDLTYTGGAAVADALSYTQTAGVGFTVFGTGTNTFSWTAYTDAT